jgi:hypothetical protein
MIRGKKNFLPPSPLVMGIGFLFVLDESSLARHLGERRKCDDDDLDAVGESLRLMDNAQNSHQAQADSGEHTVATRMAKASLEPEPEARPEPEPELEPEPEPEKELLEPEISHPKEIVANVDEDAYLAERVIPTPDGDRPQDDAALWELYVDGPSVSDDGAASSTRLASLPGKLRPRFCAHIFEWVGDGAGDTSTCKFTVEVISSDSAPEPENAATEQVRAAPHDWRLNRITDRV